ncbi:MAG: hypothetical protein JST30_08645 [Armatimonadetes bacterium]|nr:hypothetical protein [Armatimonadota bacterium]
MSARLTALCVCSALLFPANADVTNGNFEIPGLGSGNWSFNTPDVPGWTLNGSSGLANGNTVWGNGGHSSEQFALLQSTWTPGSVTQTLHGLTPGNKYRLRFWLRQRPGEIGTPILVTKDGSLDVFTALRPFSRNWIEFATDWFFAGASDQTFTWSVNDDRSFLTTELDDIVLESWPPPPPVESVPNPGFELPVMAEGEWKLQPTSLSLSWQFSASSGLANGLTQWGNGAGEGTQYSFLQKSGKIAQLIGPLDTGKTYALRCLMMRSTIGTNGIPVEFRFNGVKIIPSRLVNTDHWTDVRSDPFFGPDYPYLEIVAASSGGSGAELVDGLQIIEAIGSLAESYSIQRGIHKRGTLESLVSSDDDRFEVQNGFVAFQGEAPVQFILKGTSFVLTPKYLSLAIEGSAPGIGLQTDVSLYDYVAGTWVTIKQLMLSDIDQVFTITPSGPVDQFVNSLTGEIKVRFASKANQVAPLNMWRARFDRFKWFLGN